MAGCAAPASPAAPAGTPAGASAGGSVAQVRCSTERPGTATGDPDFALYGFPQVAARQRFTPGSATTVSASGITVSLPSDLYTSPLEFELLTGDASVWQPCVEADQVVIVPYAYRVTDPATGQRVGRFDKPVKASIEDPRLGAPVTYWRTSAENPAKVAAFQEQPTLAGTTIEVENGSARIGWFATAPRR